ncbi:helix-hairpin-helix domain-containing protein [Arcanobacterium ihumii]|uniref:helix-hairpin-helix domain-containing protein n=1 Tax=Arcanobacterium ihumii TaxID=2138162 RepID=UPI000F52B246|nr:helix-hairpin-helix domain-containing protein [Arcanobacterium ihumii]
MFEPPPRLNNISTPSKTRQINTGEGETTVGDSLHHRSPRSRLREVRGSHDAWPAHERIQGFKESAFLASVGDDVSANTRMLPKNRFALKGSAFRVFVLVVVLAMGITIARATAASDRSITPIPEGTLKNESSLPPNEKGSSTKDNSPKDESGKNVLVSKNEGGDVSKISGATMLVYVTGAVQTPGVVRINPNSRVNDAVSAAGGLTQDADATAVNLAAPITDGEHIHIPKRGERSNSDGTGIDGASKEGTINYPSSQPQQKKISLNSATEADLDSLAGIGPVTAQQIIQWRNKHGKFTSIEQLQEINGVGPKTLDKIKPFVTV